MLKLFKMPKQIHSSITLDDVFVSVDFENRMFKITCNNISSGYIKLDDSEGEWHSIIFVYDSPLYRLIYE